MGQLARSALLLRSNTRSSSSRHLGRTTRNASNKPPGKWLIVHGSTSSSSSSCSLNDAIDDGQAGRRSACYDDYYVVIGTTSRAAEVAEDPSLEAQGRATAQSWLPAVGDGRQPFVQSCFNLVIAAAAAAGTGPLHVGHHGQCHAGIGGQPAAGFHRQGADHLNTPRQNHRSKLDPVAVDGQVPVDTIMSAAVAASAAGGGRRGRMPHGHVMPLLPSLLARSAGTSCAPLSNYSGLSFLGPCTPAVMKPPQVAIMLAGCGMLHIGGHPRSSRGLPLAAMAHLTSQGIGQKLFLSSLPEREAAPADADGASSPLFTHEEEASETRRKEGAAAADMAVVSRGSCPSTTSATTSISHGSCPLPGDAGLVREMKLAQTGEGIAECELLEWFVKEGDPVRAFDTLCRVQSDKATVDITSRYEGTVLRTHFVPGDLVKVGEVLADILCSAPDPSLALDLQREGQQQPPNSVNSLAESRAAGGSVLATPAVRHMARSYGINLASVAGTGKGGRVMKEDVLSFVAAKDGIEEEVRMEEEVLEGKQESGRVVGGEVDWVKLWGDEGDRNEKRRESDVKLLRGGQEEVGRRTVNGLEDRVIPLRGYHRAMAKSMAAAAAIPHFNFMDEVSMAGVMRVRAALAGALEKEGGELRLTHLAVIIKALSLALGKHPLVNSSINEELTEITCKAAHNIGVAMATPHGLVVPNIKNCELKSIFEIATELQRLREAAQSNSLASFDVKGGTISVSNIGSIGGIFAAPIINQSEAAIVALGRTRTLPRFNEGGAVVPVPLMPVSWSADHRVVDGATLVSLCQDWKELLECPDKLLLHMR